MLMDTGGNCGNQASTLIVRGLALEQIEVKDYYRVAFKEFRVSLIIGIVLAAVNGVRVLIMYRQPVIALVTGLALIAAIIIAKLIGCSMPILATKLKLDPALMASPLITTIVDCCTIIIYFRIATLIFHM